MRRRDCFVLVCFAVMGTWASAGAVRVALVRSWYHSSNHELGAGGLLRDLEASWGQYGATRIEADTSLLEVEHFTYEDLVATGADVLWLSNLAGHRAQLTADEIEAVGQYAAEGHDVVGTYATLQHKFADNRGLAPILGLRADIGYSATINAQGAFDLIEADHPLFENVNDPLVSGGYLYAMVPASGRSWEAEHLAGARVLAMTGDHRGVITWYETDAYHAIYISEMLEYDTTRDKQFFYNMLTIPEPCTLVLLGFGWVLMGVRRR